MLAMHYYWSYLPHHAHAPDFLKLGLDPFSIYIDVGPLGIQCFHGACICFMLAGFTWMFSRMR
jgi:hypothetical protein